MQFAGIVAALPKIYWKTISTVLRHLVAAGLVEQLESRTAILNGVKYYTFRYRQGGIGTGQ
jgi:DNA-binding HxlR family transcriptional regulator